MLPLLHILPVSTPLAPLDTNTYLLYQLNLMLRHEEQTPRGQVQLALLRQDLPHIVRKLLDVADSSENVLPAAFRSPIIALRLRREAWCRVAVRSWLGLDGPREVWLARRSIGLPYFASG